MSKPGKSFEKTIRLIQETLKGSAETLIFSNHKLTTRTGRKREIDILLVTKINEFEINIAIECKDYSKPVGAKEVEAFNSKCDLLSTPINKKVLVSSNGYQAGAIDSAEQLGVELLKTEQLTNDVIMNWMPIMQLGMEFLPPRENLVLHIASEDHDFINRTLKAFNSMIHFDSELPTVHVRNFLTDYINSQKQLFWKLGFLEWIKKSDSEKGEPIELSFQLETIGSFILGEQQERVNLNGLSTSVKVRFKKTPAIIKDGKTLIDAKGSRKANAVKIDIGHDLTSDIIVDANSNTEIFLTDADGQTKKLQHLFTFNPKTGKLTKEGA